MSEQPVSEKINEIRTVLAALSHEQLAELSSEDIIAFSVTLRSTLEKVQEVRSGEGKLAQELDRLTT
jgi:hypothetical protein